jgi:microsomal dipeptidase-like Zn-dependent dipeptidase
MREAVAKQALASPDTLTAVVSGLERVELLPNLTAEMEARGFAEDEIRLFLGGNWMRVFAEVLQP